MKDDSARGGFQMAEGKHQTRAVKDVEAQPDVLSGGSFPLAPLAERQNSITQAHVGKG
jgi:hypothetical protein